MAVPSFEDQVIRQLSEILQHAATHDQLNDIFASCGIDEQDGGSKPRRIRTNLSARQRQDGCGNNVANFIQAIMNPVRFVGRPDEFDGFRHDLNEILAFVGLHIGKDGKLGLVAAARTIDEARERAGRLRSELQRRGVHPEVLKYCRAELLQENYFHAVLEATKSVAEKIRNRTGLTGDGADIVDVAFGLKNPLLAINTLRTETEQSEQKGFANLLKGTFGTFRNVTAHAARITWPISEEDALDLLSLVSYLHRRLDSAVKIPSIRPG